MLSLLSQRLVFRVPSLGVNAVLRARVVPNTTCSSLTSRTWSRSFVSTPLLAYPAAKTATKAKSSTKASSATTKKTGIATKKTAAAKPKPAKRVGVVAKKVVKPKVVRFAKEDLPPKRPTAPFVLFAVKYRQTHLSPTGNTLEESRDIVKKAGEAWRAMSEQEMAPYKEEFQVAREEYLKRRQEYYDNVSDKLINQINRDRAKNGKQKIATRSQFTGIKRPSVFLMFLADFRKTYAPPADLTLDARRVNYHIAEAGGKAWRALPESQKAVYQNKYTEAFKDYLKAKAEADATKST